MDTLELCRKYFGECDSFQVPENIVIHLQNTEFSVQKQCCKIIVDFLKTNITEQCKPDERFSLAILLFRTTPNLLDHSDCMDLIFQAIQADCTSTSTSLFSALVPLAKIHNQEIVDLILEKLANTSSNLSFILSVFCSLSDHLFPSNSFLLSQFFWTKIQEGINHEDNLSRKRALYLIKRTLDCLFESGMEVETSNSRTDLVHFTKQSVHIQKKMWNEYFVVIETLEEKQVHLVKQVLGKVGSLSNLSSAVLSNEKPLHFSWVLTAYQRLFSHVNLSLVKWSIEHFLSSFQLSQEIAEHKAFSRFICGPLLLALNDTKLYMKEGETLTGPEMCLKLSTMISTAAACMDESKAKILVRNFVCAVTSRSWGPLPLMWTSCALPSIVYHPCIGDEELEQVRRLVDHQMVYQEPLLRGAAQSFLLEAIINFADPTKCGYTEVASLLHSFYHFKVLFPNTKLWDKVSRWVRTKLFDDDISSLVEHTHQVLSNLKQNPTSHSTTLATTERIVLLFVMFVSSGETKTQQLSMLTEPLLENLTHTDRPYAACRNNLNKEEAVRMELYVISAIRNVEKMPERRRGKDFLLHCELDQNQGSSKISENVNDENTNLAKVRALENAIACCINSNDVDCMFRADFYLKLLLDFVGEGHVDEAVIENLLNSAKVVYEAPETELGLIRKAISMRIIRLMLNSESLKEQVKRSAIAAVLNHVRTSETIILTLMTEKQRNLDIQNRDEQKLWGKISCQYQNDQWQILNFLFKLNSNIEFSRDVKQKILESGFFTLEKGGKECLVSVVETINLLNMPNMAFMETTKRFIFEYRKNEVFWAAMEPFLQMCTSGLETEPEAVIEVFDSLTKAAELGSGIFTKLILTVDKYLENLPSLETKLRSVKALIPVLSQAILFGPVYRKDQRMITETNQYIFQMGEDVPANFIEGSDHLIDCTVRILGLKIILDIAKSGPVGEVSSIIIQIMESHQEIVDIALGSRNRYYENSFVHRLNQRMNQACLVFCPLVDSESACVLFQQQCSRLLDHNQQTSVRYYIEWSLIVLCTRHKFLVPQLWEWLSKAAQHRAGAVVSFITVVTHYACLEQSKDVFDEAIKEITPWCMAQHFGTRIVAQICFRKLWEACQNKEHSELLLKYQVLRDCLNRSVYQGNAEKTAEKLSEDFYLSNFDPQIHFSFSDIFYEVPRLCGMSTEECIPVQLLEKYLKHFYIPICSPSNSLSKCAPSKLVSKDPLTSQEYGESENIQKKIIPWKSMFAGSENDSNLLGKKDTANPDLVMVASLIDRAPNLGGLCRTCEIFGVGTYVVPSLSVLKDKDFTAVSVTAENWVPIEEASMKTLPSYLSEKQKQGWTIVGVEQTQESRPLQEFKFPKKCVLLLGSEKEGIPVELLQQVDICVEIPQQGLIRSLNVHVTGALVLWEYVRQHLDK